MTSIIALTMEKQAPSRMAGAMVTSVGLKTCRIAALSVMGLLAACGGGSGGGSSTGTTTAGSAATNTSSTTTAGSGTTTTGTTTDTGTTTTASSGTCDITVTTADSYSKIEAANPGQTVCISPGTYHFRVTLTKAGTASAPIVIRALDPNNRPVFDYTSSTHSVDGWPGSYNASDAVRSAWRVTGSYYTIDGIIIQGANNASNNWNIYDNTAGIRYLKTTNLTVRNCRLYNNDMGIQGGGSNTVIEYTEFDRNGAPATDQSHNLYILGGDNFTLRYSYLHDSVGGQNFHIRARNATVAYNWIQNASAYEGDMMANQSDYDPGANGIQTMLFIGNVVIQKSNPNNYSKLISLYNQPEAGNMTFNLTAVWNTFVFNEASQTTGSGVVQLVYGTSYSTTGNIVFSNNVVAGINPRTAVIIKSGLGAANISGTNNFFLTGSSVSPLLNTKFASNVLFNSGAYSLQTASPAFGYASGSVTPAPAWYFVGMPTTGGLVADKISARTNTSNPGAIQ